MHDTREENYYIKGRRNKKKKQGKEAASPSLAL
jgi:hypothetical protein